ncbi:RcnB family protein [Novosphingobium bradum]|uniref:RcnB family protein n=1 Tax=Novosphingobium bradum TaxID=1737444 RepID=A0ABV7IQK4_9SPHN
MAAKHFITPTAMVALAVGLAAAAIPGAANAQDDDHGRRGGWQQGGGEGRGNRGDGEGRGEGRGGWQRSDAAPAPQVQAQVQVQAQQPPPRGDNGERRGQFASGWNNRGGEPPRQPPPVVQRGPEGPRPDADGWRGRPVQQPRQYQGQYQGRDGQRWQGQNWNGDRTVRVNPQPRWEGRRDFGRAGNWNRDWRRDDRFAWQSWRNQHRDVFRMGRYHSPYNNWSYRRLGIGVFLQPLFFSQDYWIDDPWAYRLPEAYGPYRWVRYYDDALLVNIYNGEVADVIYDFFW